MTGSNRTEPKFRVPRVNIRGGDPTSRGNHGRLDLSKTKDNGLVSPEKRMAEHKASKAHRGPGGMTSVRVRMRLVFGDERPTVRKMYDRTTKPRKRRKAKP